MKEVVVMRGPSGSGKTTYARKNFPDSVIVSADSFFLKTGVYVFDPKLLEKAHGWCLRRFLAELDLDECGTLVVDNTNCTAVEMAPYVALAKSRDVPVRVIELRTPLVDCIARNVHGVSAATIERQRARMETERIPSFWPIPEIIYV